MWGCYSGDAQTGPEQRAVGTDMYMGAGACVSAFVNIKMKFSYLLWMELGPGQRTAFP